jgi:hypothetical protein
MLNTRAPGTARALVADQFSTYSTLANMSSVMPAQPTKAMISASVTVRPTV